MTRKMILLILALGLVNNSCSLAARERDSSPGLSPPFSTLEEHQSIITYKAVPCDYEDQPVHLECGYLTVPEDHRNPDKGMIQLAVTVVKATGEDPALDPVLYLEGNSQGSVTDSVESWLDQPFLERRDLLLIDPRGAGHSVPNLNCPEMEGEGYENTIEAAQACIHRLENEGIDLSLYNSAQSAADLNALFITKGYKDWNLLGVSNGTRIALTLMRDYPQGIRSAILDSVYPPQVNVYEEQVINGVRAFRTLFTDCANNADCARAYPDLEAVFYDLLYALDENPVEVVSQDPQTQEDVHVFLDGVQLANLLLSALYDAETIQKLPFVIYEVYFGNYEAISDLIFTDIENVYTHHYDEGTLSRSEGVYYSTECFEEVAFNKLNTAKTALDGVNSPAADYLFVNVVEMFSICESWDSGQADEVETQAVRSDIPTLILAGEYDPITPPTWGRVAANFLNASFFYTFPGVGHSVIDLGECPQNILADFLDNPKEEPDTTCLAEMEGAQFYLPRVNP